MAAALLRSKHDLDRYGTSTSALVLPSHLDNTPHSQAAHTPDDNLSAPAPFDRLGPPTSHPGAIICIHALNGEALLRLYMVIVGFLQQRLIRKLVAIMLMRRVTGPMPFRRKHFNNEQTVCRLLFRQNIVNVPLVVPVPRASTPTSPGAIRRAGWLPLPGASHTASSTFVRAFSSYLSSFGT